jgi:hypothetical protein
LSSNLLISLNLFILALSFATPAVRLNLIGVN